MRIEHTIDIPVPTGTVWALTTDVENLPGITPAMTEVARLDDSPLTVGSQARIRQPGQRTRVWSVIDLEPERRFAWSTRAMGSTMTGVHELSPVDGGTRNTLAIELDGWSAPVVGWLLAPMLRGALAKENAGIRDAACREADREVGHGG